MTSSALQRYSEAMLPAIEQELKRQVERARQQETKVFADMLAYHMGWLEAGSGVSAGKRIRPLVVLLVTEACGEQWLRAISPASAVELIHNFSLVHDDIEDNSPTRRGRVTAWKKYGIPMAINAGDALFAIATQAMLDASAHFSAERVLHATACLQDACLRLTCGQFLDMSYERRADISAESYWPMVNGKTAALLSAAAAIGAILGGASDPVLQNYAEFARNLGLAFQVQDDILGIWGDESATGKSVASDLVEGKNSLPILYGIGQRGKFAVRWAAGPVSPEETRPLAQLLKEEGAYAYAEAEAARLTELAMASLHGANPQADAGEALAELAAKLLQRKS